MCCWTVARRWSRPAPMAPALIAVDFYETCWVCLFQLRRVIASHERMKRQYMSFVKGINLRFRLLINHKRWSLPFPRNHRAGLSDWCLSRHLRRRGLRCLIKMVIQWLGGLQEILPLASLPLCFISVFFYTDAIVLILWTFGTTTKQVALL